MDAALKERFDTLVNAHPVVLFMKGTRTFPQCGFSARVVGILDDVLDEYETVNVLAEPEVREGIKEYSDWPTIPQLYIQGEFVGGCDIVTEMSENGELNDALGDQVREAKAPELTVSAAALSAIQDASADEEHKSLRFEVTPRFEYGLSFGPQHDGDYVVELDGLTVFVDKKSARRADGVSIDFIDGPGGTGFKIENPNEPPKVKQISVEDLKKMFDDGETFELFDVRSDEERDTAKLDASKPLTREVQDELMQLPKDTKLVFMCHHGGRSAQAAQHFLTNGGFTNVFNVEGGIDAWSLRIDSNVPRY